jgi:hypothetical protein
VCASEQATNFVHRLYRVNTWEGHSRLYLGCKCQGVSGEGRLPLLLLLLLLPPPPPLLPLPPPPPPPLLLLLADRRRCFADDQPLTVRHNSNGDLEDRLVMSRQQQQQIHVANTASTNLLSRKSFAIQI